MKFVARNFFENRNAGTPVAPRGAISFSICSVLLWDIPVVRCCGRRRKQNCSESLRDHHGEADRP